MTSSASTKSRTKASPGQGGQADVKSTEMECECPIAVAAGARSGDGGGVVCVLGGVLRSMVLRECTARGPASIFCARVLIVSSCAG